MTPMKLVLFTHPAFSASQSMPRFARSLAESFVRRGHTVTLRTARAYCRRIVTQAPWDRWAGYIDQYLIYPLVLRKQLHSDPPDTLYVFCDQALGPWVPWVAHRPHVVHCHDLLALRSALGHFPQNPTGVTGRIYQRFIRRGFQRARHFISISRRTQQDLHEHGGVQPMTSEVVYNGLNHPYVPMEPGDAQRALALAGLPAAPAGLLLHLSVGIWYKNVPGLLRLYAHYARSSQAPLPLWLVGVPEDAALRAVLAEVPASGRVHFLHGLDNQTLQAAYSWARAFLFPSLAEGFGWPIAEAQACGCPVITTAEAPMTEVGGPHTRYLPLLRPHDDVQQWARNGAEVLGQLLALPDVERHEISMQCVQWARRFDTDVAIDGYLRVYQRVLKLELQQSHASSPRGVH